MKKVLILSAFVLLFSPTFAQVDWDWTHTVNSPNENSANKIAIDGNGNMFVMGFFVDTLVFGTDSLFSVGQESNYLAKYSSTGTYEWSKSYRLNSFQSGDIETDIDGNVYIVLSYGNGGLTTGSTTVTGPGFIAKYSTSGDMLWHKSIESSSGFSLIPSIEIANNGKVYVLGSFVGSFTLDTISRTIQSDRRYGYLMTLDVSGNVYGIKQVSNDDYPSYNCGVADMELDTDGLVLLLYTGGNIDLGNGIFLAPCSSAIVKYDNNINCQWEMHASASEWADIMDLHVSDSAIYMTGFSLSFYNFDTVSVSGSDDLFIMKANKSGHALWMKTYGSNNMGFGLSLGTDFQENIYLLGGFNNTLTFGPDVMTANGQTNSWAAFDDVFIGKLDENGIPLWARNAGDCANRGFGSIYTSVVGDVYFVGYEVDTLNSGTKTEEIIKNSFISRKDNTNPPAPASEIIGSNNVCENETGIVYTVPEILNADSYEWTLPAFATGTSTTNSITLDFGSGPASGTLSVKGINNNGQGDVAELSLNINLIPATPVITFENDTLYSSSNTGNQWYNSDGLITGAIDSIYIPTTNDGYYSVVTINSCFNTSAIYQVTNIGINETELSNSINVFPNPTNGLFSVTGNDLTLIQVIDNTGRIVLESTSQNNFDLSNMENGIYTIKAQSKERVITTKMVLIK